MNAGDVVSYLEMCAEFGVNLQRGMNFRLTAAESLILMSLRPGAPYADGVEDGGRVIIYEGHNLPLTKGGADPKTVDQPESLPSGRLTQNGLFADAVRRFKAGRAEAERVKVFEKSVRDMGLQRAFWVSRRLARDFRSAPSIQVQTRNLRSILRVSGTYDKQGRSR